MAKNERKFIGVIGASDCSPDVAEIAQKVGELIAKNGDVLICGGLGGVMEAACKGAREVGGLTIGILPGDERDSANAYVDIPIVTGVGYARNLIIVKSSDGLIAVAGRYGTLSEIAFASTLGVPVVGISTWEIGQAVIKAETADEALERLYCEM